MRVSSSGLVVPDNALDATEQYCSPEQAAQDSFEARWFREELKKIDSRLDLVFVKPGSEAFEHDGRWYIWRRNEHTVDSWWVIQGEQGEYCAPSWRHLERFKAGDAARNPNLWKEFEKEREDRRRRAEKRKEELRAEFREKLGERLDHIFDKRIAVTGAMKDKLGG